MWYLIHKMTVKSCQYIEILHIKRSPLRMGLITPLSEWRTQARVWESIQLVVLNISIWLSEKVCIHMRLGGLSNTGVYPVCTSRQKSTNYITKTEKWLVFPQQMCSCHIVVVILHNTASHCDNLPHSWMNWMLDELYCMYLATTLVISKTLL